MSSNEMNRSSQETRKAYNNLSQLCIHAFYLDPVVDIQKREQGLFLCLPLCCLFDCFYSNIATVLHYARTVCCQGSSLDSASRLVMISWYTGEVSISHHKQQWNHKCQVCFRGFWTWYFLCSAISRPLMSAPDNHMDCILVKINVIYSKGSVFFFFWRFKEG